MRTYFLIFFCVFSAATVHAGQTCKTSTVPASTPSSQLVDNGDGTITDSKTGLMWKKCLEGVTGDNCEKNSPSTFTWQKAVKYTETVNDGDSFAGHTDWRLPTIRELSSIVEQQCYKPAINTIRFPNTPNSFVWAKTLYSGHSDYAWCVNFSNGRVAADVRSINSSVRLVRGGQ
jgi:hypothetical protein